MNLSQSFTNIDEVEKGDLSNNCPYKGSIITEGRHIVFGFFMPYTNVLATIDDSWKVTAANDSKGWIDRNGQIHKGVTGCSNFLSTDEEIVGNIVGDMLFLRGIKVGKLIRANRK